jgi:D-amino-acid dehydrogenase
MTSSNEKTALIIGGGIIGVNVACFLSEAGFAVRLIDRDGICEGTSSGNAAALAFSDILPMAQKGMLAKVPGWLMDPLGPLSIPPAYALHIMPWLLRLLREGRADRREASIAAQVAMMNLSKAETLALADRAGISGQIGNDGSLEVYTSEVSFQSGLPGWALREKHGVPFEHVRGERLAELQPGLASKVIAATFSPTWRTVSNPQTYTRALWAYAKQLGAVFEQGEVRELRPFAGGASVELKDGRRLSADYVINCAGAWSHKLAATIGESMPLEAERGYNTTLPRDAFDAKRMIIFGEDGFVLTPLVDGIRIGGAVELGGLKLAPNYKRSEAMMQKAKSYLPGLKTDGGKQWMGYRPSLPDTLPAIGRSKASPHIIHAFGHGHLGLTQSGATGRLVRDLVAEQSPAIDLSPFNPHRF